MPNLSIAENAAREKAIHERGWKFVNIAKYVEWYYGTFLLLPKKKQKQIFNERVWLKNEFKIKSGEFIILISPKYVIYPLAKDNWGKCKACGEMAMHYIMVKGKKVLHCPKKVCINSLTRGKE